MFAVFILFYVCLTGLGKFLFVSNAKTLKGSEI